MRATSIAAFEGGSALQEPPFDSLPKPDALPLSPLPPALPSMPPPPPFPPAPATVAASAVPAADRRRNLYPTKSRPDPKIDAAVALMMAFGRAMIEDADAKGLEGFLTNPIFG